MKQVFLTGGRGFLGSHLLTALGAHNYSVVAATRGQPSALPKNFSGRVEWVSSKNAVKVINAIKPYAVIHLATDYGIASSPYDTLIANEAWPLSLLEAAVNAGTTLFLNTDSFFGKPAFAYPHMRPYTLSKSNFLAWGRYTSVKTRTRFVTLRLEHVYGENDSANKFVPALLAKLQTGETIEATVGTQRRDFVYAGDVARAYVTVLNRHISLPFDTDEIEVGTGRSVTVRSFVEVAKTLCGSSSPIRFGAIPMRQNEITDSFADTATLKALGWAPQSSLEDGLLSCIGAMQFLPHE